MKLFPFILLCWRAWARLQTKPTAYLTLENRHGVQEVALFVARDREAWRVTEFAIAARFAAERMD